jgi:hypothetical protein
MFSQKMTAHAGRGETPLSLRAGRPGGLSLARRGLVPVDLATGNLVAGHRLKGAGGALCATRRALLGGGNRAARMVIG